MPDVQPDPHPISIPAGYAPAFAVGYSDGNGALSLARHDSPLPVEMRFAAAAPVALTGSASASETVGPFHPVPGRPVILVLSGDWSGTVQLERSVDDGATRHPLTVAGSPWARFNGNACEAVWSESEAGVSLYLDASLESGTLEYRIAQ